MFSQRHPPLHVLSSALSSHSKGTCVKTSTMVLVESHTGGNAKKFEQPDIWDHMVGRWMDTHISCRLFGNISIFPVHLHLSNVPTHCRSPSCKSSQSSLSECLHFFKSKENNPLYLVLLLPRHTSYSSCSLCTWWMECVSEYCHGGAMVQWLSTKHHIPLLRCHHLHHHVRYLREKPTKKLFNTPFCNHHVQTF